MRALLGDFALPPTTNRVTAVLLLFGIVACLHALWVRDGLISEIEAKHAELTKTAQFGNSRPLVSPDHAAAGPKARAAAQSLAQDLGRPWEKWIDEVQKASRPDILISRMQPEPASRRMEVSGQADSSEAFLGFVARLRKQSAWTDVVPIAQEEGGGAGIKPVSFRVLLEWGPT